VTKFFLKSSINNTIAGLKLFNKYTFVKNAGFWQQCGFISKNKIDAFNAKIATFHQNLSRPNS